MKQRKVVEDSIFGIGLLSGSIGYMTLSLFQDYARFGYLFLGVGVLCMVDYFLNRSVFDVIFRACELGSGSAYPILIKKTDKGTHKLYEFSLPAGLSTSDVEDRKEAIEQYLGRKIDISYGFKNMYIKVYPNKEKTDYPYIPYAIKNNAVIIIGFDREGNMVTIDMSNCEPHLLIAGESGSGKSTILHSIITNAIVFNDINIYLIDLKKGAEFCIYKDCKKVIGFATTETEGLRVLREIENEVNRRYFIFAENHVNNIEKYKALGFEMKYQFLFVDEFSFLMYNENSRVILENLSAIARAAGVYLCLATQRPDNKVITGRIKANFCNILGLKTLDAVNSTIIIQHKGLEKLRGKGHGVFKKGIDETYIQGFNIQQETAAYIVEPFNNIKGDPDYKSKLEAEEPIIVDFTFMDGDD